MKVAVPFNKAATTKRAFVHVQLRQTLVAVLAGRKLPHAFDSCVELHLAAPKLAVGEHFKVAEVGAPPQPTQR